MPSISIIICTRGRSRVLRVTLEVVDRVVPRQDPPVELVIVDNGSKDDTRSVIEDFARQRPGVKYVFEPRAGKSLALNSGAKAATGEILAWLDDDILPEPGWLEGLIQSITDDKHDMVVGRVALAPHLLRDWMTDNLRQRMGEMPWSNGGTFPLGGNLALTRKFHDKTEGHDPNLGPGGFGRGTHEDTFFALQLIDQGARVGYADQAAVVHHFDVTRLQRKYWLESAKGQGQSSAYIFHHWDHAKTSLPLVREWRKRFQLWIWRLKHRPNLDPESEGISTDELALVQQIAFFQQYRVESRKPYNYDKRGLHRKSGDNPA